MQKVCLDFAGVNGSHMGPPIKLKLLGILCNFFLFGTDPEKHGADPEKQGSVLLCPPQGASKVAPFLDPFFRLWRPRRPKSA